MSDSIQPTTVYAVQAIASEEAADMFMDLLAGQDVISSMWQHAAEPTGIVSSYFTSREEADDMLNQWEGWLNQWADWISGAIELKPILEIPGEDWSESWKRHFKPRRVSERVVILPSWEKTDFKAKPNDILVEIDPGMSFGTGQHGTTMACIQMLEKLHQNGVTGPMVDVGCGSGILSIAAEKVGISPIDAFDYDPVAVESAADNLTANTSSAITLSEGDVTIWTPASPYPIVVVNILAVILIEHAERIAAAVRPDGHLLLSGILTEQFPDVIRAYEAKGFVCKDSITIDEWTSGHFIQQAQ